MHVHTYIVYIGTHLLKNCLRVSVNYKVLEFLWNYTVFLSYKIRIRLVPELEIVTQKCSANLSEHSKSCSAIARF